MIDDVPPIPAPPPLTPEQVAGATRAELEYAALFYAEAYRHACAHAAGAIVAAQQLEASRRFAWTYLSAN